MNKILFLSVAVLLLAGTSCKKSLLEQGAPDRLTTDNFWTNKDRALAGLSAAYSQLEGFVAWDNYVEARSVREFYREDYIVPGADAYNYTWWTDHYDFNVTPGNYAVDLLWRENYRGLNFTNQVLENVPRIPAAALTDADRKMILAEARFLRAYYHFKLLNNFKKIILRTKVPTSEADLPKALSERKEAYDLILGDLKAAEPDLPLKSQRPATEMGRITKGAAQAYLGKVLLYRAGEEQNNPALLDEASSWFNKVIQSNEYSLDNNFIGMFNGQTKNGRESIFELQQTNDATGGALYRSFLSDWVAATELGGYGEIYGTPRLLNEMTKEGKVSTTPGQYDMRVYNTLYFEDPFFNTPGAVYGSTYNTKFGAGSGIIAFRKWIPPTPNRIGRSNGINVPLMRYADVLLLQAEVLNTRNQPAQAMVLINQVRTNRGMPTLNLATQADVMNQIMHERVMEFTLEGSRFYDLRRWGILAENMTAAARKFTQGEDEFYPLPLKETINNPLVQ